MKEEPKERFYFDVVRINSHRSSFAFTLVFLACLGKLMLISGGKYMKNLFAPALFILIFIKDMFLDKNEFDCKQKFSCFRLNT